MINTILDLLSSLANNAFLILGDAAIKGLIILLVVTVCLMFIKKTSAARRHLIWVLGLFVVGVMPIMSYCLPRWQIPILPEQLVRWQVQAEAPAIATQVNVQPVMSLWERRRCC